MKYVYILQSEQNAEHFYTGEAGASINDIVEWLDPTRAQVAAVLDFAARSFEVPAHR